MALVIIVIVIIIVIAAIVIAAIVIAAIVIAVIVGYFYMKLSYLEVGEIGRHPSCFRSFRNHQTLQLRVLSPQAATLFA